MINAATNKDFTVFVKMRSLEDELRFYKERVPLSNVDLLA